MSFWSRFLDNPVFVKEMRIGFREKKVFFALTAWVIIVALFASISSAAALSETKNISELPEAGKWLFELLLWLQIVLLAMLGPSLTTSAVSGERERQSFEMLLTTHLSPSELIFGKFGFAASFVVLALFSTVPLEAIVFFLGGVSLVSFLYAKLILLAFGALCSLLGLMLSARETRSAYATGQTYFILLVASIPTMMGFSFLRYTPNPPLAAYALAVILAIYLMLFLYWKAVNHLEERAAHLKILLAIGLVFYVLLIATALSEPKVWGSLKDSLWIFYAPFHYILMGIFLSPILPTRARERRIFLQSPLSRPALWMTVLCAGVLLPMIHAGDESFIVVALYTIMAGMGTGLLARGLSMRQPARYPFFLGFSWLLLNVLPAFTAIGGVEGPERVWHPVMISPFYYLVSSYDTSWHDAPLLALCFYILVGGVGLILSLTRKERPVVVTPIAKDPG